MNKMYEQNLYISEWNKLCDDDIITIEEEQKTTTYRLNETFVRQ